jgi:hypothetical protein
MSRPLLLLCVLLIAPSASAKPKPKAPASAPSTQIVEPTAASQPSADPFLRLKVITPKGKLPPLSSVRVRDKREAEDRSRKGTITVSINTTPKGASVYYGGKLLGTTPLGLSAQRGSTPFDVVIRRGGYMTLHTRIMRKTTRGYFFKLTPAKLR